MKKDMSILKEKKLFVLDMDGTFYLGSKIIDGSLRFIGKLRELKKDFIFFTNNSSRDSETYLKKLAGMGLEVDGVKVITSGDITIKYLQEKYPKKGVYLVGTEYLESSFRRAGIELKQHRADVVVIGFDTTLTYEKISKACGFIREGAVFVATHPDLNCPVEHGSIPDCGAMCSMITASTGVLPKYLGKPFEETIIGIRRITGYNNDDMVFVGDRLSTDIAIGAKNNVTSILVLSGETKIKDLERSDIQPDFVFDSLSHIIDHL